MRDSRKETEECETINKFLVRFRKFHRGVLEKHTKQNILSHIWNVKKSTSKLIY